MRPEDVLAAVGTGLWHWDEAAGTVSLDARAARLLGLPAEPVTARSATIRACLHTADYVALTGALTRAHAEGTVAESLLRVIADDGTVLRTLRTRVRPTGRETVTGTLHEVRGATPPEPEGTGDSRRAREGFLLDAGRALAEDVRAAGLMGQLRIALRAYASEGHRPDAVLSRASRFLTGLTSASEPGEEQRYATCLYLEVDPPTGTVDVVRAGHPDPAIRLGDGTTIVRRTAGGLPLGIVPDSDYPTTRLVLEPGEVVMVCTDGLIETGGHDLESGWRRLRAVLESSPADDLEALADSLVGIVHGPVSHYTTGPLADRREDDVALLLLRRDPDGATCAVPVRRTVLTVAQSDPRQIRAARQEVRALLHDWRIADQVDTAELLVSELLTNVLVHTDEDAVLTARLLGVMGARRLRIDVGDRNDDMPHRRDPGELASTGRGLVLIEELADAWGVEPRGDGKAIWFEFYEMPAAG